MDKKDFDMLPPFPQKDPVLRKPYRHGNNVLFAFKDATGDLRIAGGHYKNFAGLPQSRIPHVNKIIKEL